MSTPFLVLSALLWGRTYSALCYKEVPTGLIQSLIRTVLSYPSPLFSLSWKSSSEIFGCSGIPLRCLDLFNRLYILVSPWKNSKLAFVYVICRYFSSQPRYQRRWMVLIVKQARNVTAATITWTLIERKYPDNALCKYPQIQQSTDIWLYSIQPLSHSVIISQVCSADKKNPAMALLLLPEGFSLLPDKDGTLQRSMLRFLATARLRNTGEKEFLPPSGCWPSHWKCVLTFLLI